MVGDYACHLPVAHVTFCVFQRDAEVGRQIQAGTRLSCEQCGSGVDTVRGSYVGMLAMHKTCMSSGDGLVAFLDIILAEDWVFGRRSVLRRKLKRVPLDGLFVCVCVGSECCAL